MSYEDDFLFLWYHTRHIFTMGSFEKRGAERGALTKLWMALKHKKLMKNTYCNDLFELKANKRTPFRPLFRNISDLKRYVNRIPLTWNTHFIDTHRLVTIKMKLHGSLRKNEKMKIEKIEITKNCNVILFQTKCCKIRTRWAMRIIFIPVMPHASYFYHGIIWKKGGGKGCAH